MKYFIKDIGTKNKGLKKALNKLDKDVQMMMGLKEPATLENLNDLIEALFENLYIHSNIAVPISKVAKVSPKKVDLPKMKENKYTNPKAIRKLLKERKWPKDQIETAIKELA